MTSEEEHLRMSSEELFDKPHPSNIVSENNGGSKRPREVVMMMMTAKRVKRVRKRSGSLR